MLKFTQHRNMPGFGAIPGAKALIDTVGLPDKRSKAPAGTHWPALSITPDGWVLPRQCNLKVYWRAWRRRVFGRWILQISMPIKVNYIPVIYRASK